MRLYNLMIILIIFFVQFINKSISTFHFQKNQRGKIYAKLYEILDYVFLIQKYYQQKFIVAYANYIIFYKDIMEKQPAIKAIDLQNSEQWLKQLQKTGVVVIKNIISKQEVQKTIDYFWQYLEALESGIKRSDPSTWQNKSWPGLPDMGFFVSYGGCHTKASWYLRSNPRVQQAFKKIWKTDKLITSFDTMIAWRPWWVNSSWKPFVQNLHVDQNPFFKKGFKCVQGMIPLKNVRSNQVGGLQVVPGTNNNQIQMYLSDNYPFTTFNDSDWVELKADDQLCKKGLLVECDAGDLILWDSRVVHGGKIVEPNQQFKKLHSNDLVRLSMTVTMVPRQWASQQILKRRKQAFQKKIGLTHWPHQFHKNPMGHLADIDMQKVKYEWVDLTPEIQELI